MGFWLFIIGYIGTLGTFWVHTSCRNHKRQPANSKSALPPPQLRDPIERHLHLDYSWLSSTSARQSTLSSSYKNLKLQLRQISFISSKIHRNTTRKKFSAHATPNNVTPQATSSPPSSPILLYSLPLPPPIPFSPLTNPRQHRKGNLHGPWAHHALQHPPRPKRPEYSRPRPFHSLVYTHQPHSRLSPLSGRNRARRRRARISIMAAPRQPHARPALWASRLLVRTCKYLFRFLP